METDLSYHIRRVTIDDIPAFIALRSRMFAELDLGDTGEVEAVSPDYFARAIPSGEFVGLIALTPKGEAVGSAGLSIYQTPPKPMEPSGRFGYLSSVYVLPDHRRHGLASRMMDNLMEHAESIGLTWLTLHKSPMGQPLYEAIGFETWGEMGLHLPSRRRDTGGTP